MLRHKKYSGVTGVQTFALPLQSPESFSEPGLPLQQSIYQVAPRSIVVLVRPKTNG